MDLLTALSPAMGNARQPDHTEGRFRNFAMTMQCGQAIFPREILHSREYLAEVEAKLHSLSKKPALILWGDQDKGFQTAAVNLVSLQSRNTWLDRPKKGQQTRIALYDAALHELFNIAGEELPRAKFIDQHAISPTAQSENTKFGQGSFVKIKVPWNG
jgi:hypothetical protein